MQEAILSFFKLVGAFALGDIVATVTLGAYFAHQSQKELKKREGYLNTYAQRLAEIQAEVEDESVNG